MITTTLNGGTDTDGLQWVEVPPSLGGQRVKVLRVRQAACPKCGIESQHLELEGAYHVAECVTDGFVWYGP